MFSCVCGHREKLADFQKRRVGGAAYQEERAERDSVNFILDFTVEVLFGNL